MRRKTIFSAYGCPDGLEELTAEVYYSDFAQQIIKNGLYPIETIIRYILKYLVLDILRGKWNLSLYSS